MSARKRIVLSAVNLVEGGTLTVLRSCLQAAEGLRDWDVVVLVHDRSLIDATRAEIVEIPWSKRSWLHRLYFEWFRARSLSQDLRADLWFSLHDVTSRVSAPHQAVYCHNPSPFHRLTLHEAFYDPKFALFCLFYGCLYGIGIERNQWVIVQQRWLAEAFSARWAPRGLIVAHPESDIWPIRSDAVGSGHHCRVFTYPTIPRVYKNIEVIGEALRILERNPLWRGEVRLTLSGREGRYARYLKRRYGDLKTLFFIGRRSKIEMATLYQQTDCLLFPSKLETWGLPITEFKGTGRPMIVADCLYAYETVGAYADAAFFSADDAPGLAQIMLDAHLGRFEPCAASSRPAIAPPDASTWSGLLERLVADCR